MRIQTTESICPPMRPEIQRLIVTQAQFELGFSRPHFHNQFERPIVTYHPFEDPIRLIGGNISVQDPAYGPVRVIAESNPTDHQADARGNYMNTENNMASAPVHRGVVPVLDVRTLIRTAFIMGIASTVEGFNGECMCEYLAPTRVANEGSQIEPDLWTLFQNPAVSKLADLYLSNLHCLPNPEVSGPPSGGSTAPRC